MTQARRLSQIDPSAVARKEPAPHARPATPLRMSESLWGLHWPSWTFGGVSVEIAHFEEAVPFIARHYATIFATEPGRFLEEKLSDAKLRFLAQCDVFVCRDAGVVVGVFIGHPSDWATYYARSFAILPQLRERKIFKSFFAQLASELSAAGVDRIEVDTSPANVAANRLFMSLGFLISASMNTDRWAAMVRYTKYLSPEAERCFLRQYIIAPANQRAAKTPSDTKHQEEGDTP